VVRTRERVMQKKERRVKMVYGEGKKEDHENAVGGGIPPSPKQGH